MLRAIALALFLIIGIGVAIPFVSDYAEAGANKHKKNKKKVRKYKKYSKKWWRVYRQRQRRLKAMAARRRALRLRQIRFANAKKAAAQNGDNKQAGMVKVRTKFSVEDLQPAVLPSGESAPKGWKRGAMSPGELQFKVDDDNGSNLGSASIAVVGPATGVDGSGANNKTVGGVPVSSLRRTVIDRMIKEEGWVVNDYQKEIGGKKVFVVVAQSPGAGGKTNARLFYFTEVDGRIYSVATNAPAGDNSSRLEQESERVITSLQRGKSNTAVQQAELK